MKINPTPLHTYFTKKGLTYYVVSLQTVEVAKCNSKSKKVTVPATVNKGSVSYKVVSIGKKAFCGKKRLREITLGKHIKTVKKDAFKKTPKLRKIVLKTSRLKSRKQLRKAGGGKVKIVRR